MSGKIIAIHVARSEGGSLQSLTEAELVADQGIVGDRYFQADGSRPEASLSLVESEQVEHLNAALGSKLEPAETRRNIVTRGVSLNDLVGKQFSLGSVRVEGIELCEPCRYLAGRLESMHERDEITAAQIVAALTHRAGLRARIIESGTVRVDDPILV
jgi:MOSC domain-containing protein YiiM